MRRNARKFFAIQNARSWNNKLSWNDNERNGGANSRVAPDFANEGAWGTKGTSPRKFHHAQRLLRCELVPPCGAGLLVIVGAALLGGMIGGFAVFAIDSALTWEPLTREPVSQPRPDARADSQTSAVVAQTKPIRIVGGAIPDP